MVASWSMEADDIDPLLDAVRAGRRLRVPFSTTLGPDTRAHENVLSIRTDGLFELTTTFAEFWAGHGWSREQTEVEARTLEQVRSAMSSCSVEECELLR